MEGAKRIIEKREKYLLPGVKHAYESPPLLVSAYMQYIYDDADVRYTDFFSGYSVVNCGHSNPFILENIINQLKGFQHTNNSYLTEPIVQLAERLARLLPASLNRSFFCSSWSEATETALVLARNIKGRRKIIALEGGLHGRTHLAMSASHMSEWRTDPFLSEDVVFIPNASEPKESLKRLKELLDEEPESYCALIAEIIQGNGGIITPQGDYFAEIIELLHQKEAIFIADERESGFARTGKLFAFEHFGIVPDVLVYANALGNGMPIAGFTAVEEVAKMFTKAHISTLGGNPASCAAGLAVLDYIEYNDLERTALRKGEVLGEALEGVAEKYLNKYGYEAKVRGIGLMMGLKVDHVCNPSSVIERMKDKGFIIGLAGTEKDVLIFQPPIVIEESDILEMADALIKII